MKKFALFSTIDDYYFDEIYCVVSTENQAQEILDDYYTLEKLFRDVEDFKPNFTCGKSIPDQCITYLNSDVYRTFKTDQYERLKQSLNVTDKTLYDKFRSCCELDYREISSSPK